eukprot:CAMPEP_0119055826 /NCGR_PEP_ID=MMETSP1178-20130426/463_1 /TAXON_ID=33656 /ORGANISM="unid sp, Strain CCMP2000" /LENGTH=144 /DNA_ID=CAMNT_0007036469 /DNA_START=253 /DNA_END=689 /DNA_ORIENTATION=-
MSSVQVGTDMRDWVSSMPEFVLMCCISMLSQSATGAECHQLPRWWARERGSMRHSASPARRRLSSDLSHGLRATTSSSTVVAWDAAVEPSGDLSSHDRPPHNAPVRQQAWIVSGAASRGAPLPPLPQCAVGLLAAPAVAAPSPC